MTTAATGNVAGQAGDKEKEKTGMRRALGRGLASLLPGPRVVPAAAPASTTPAAVTGGSERVPAPISQASVASVASASPGPAATPAVVSPAAASRNVPADAGTPAGSIAPQVQVEGNTVRVMAPAVESDAAVMLPAGAGGQPGAAVPTFHQPDAAARSTGDMSIPATEIDTAEMDYAEWVESQEVGPKHEGPIEIQAVADTRAPANLLVAIAIRDIDRNPFQTRDVEDDDTLQELADSITAQGVVQPIVVRPAEEAGRYVLILGERRLLASKKAGKTHIPAIVRHVSAQQAAEMTIIENLQREDLSPLEQAEAFKVLSLEFNLTQQEIAKKVGLSRESIANYMRLLKLPREVLQMLAEKRINFAKAKELLKLGDNDRIAEAALYAVKKGMNMEQIEMLVLRMEGLLDPLPDMPGAQKKEGGGARWVDPNVRAAQMDLERTLGLRVRIRDRKGKGKIVIEYSTVDDYERVVEMLRGKS